MTSPRFEAGASLRVGVAGGGVDAIDVACDRRSRTRDPGPGRTWSGAADHVLLAGSVWFPRTALDLGALSVVDELNLDDRVLLWVQVGKRPGRVVLLAAREEGSQLWPSSPSAAVERLATRSQWRTAAGGVVTWRGCPQRAWRIIGDVGTTTNHVVRVVADGVFGVLKVFRFMGDGAEEERALVAAAASGLVPQVLAALDYRLPGTDDLVIALITELIAGDTLDVPLRRSLEDACRTGRPEVTAADRFLLRRVRRGVCAASSSRVPCCEDGRPAASRAGERCRRRPSVRRRRSGCAPAPGPRRAAGDDAVDRR